MVDLTAVAVTNLDKALVFETGKSADVMARDGVLRQTIIVLCEGTRLDTYNSSLAASLQVLVGKVRVRIDESQ